METCRDRFISTNHILEVSEYLVYCRLLYYSSIGLVPLLVRRTAVVYATCAVVLQQQQ